MAKRISIVVPFHWMENWSFFLERCLKSIESQSFTDYEVILVKHSTMPVTSNRAIESAEGELIKILYMDDYFAHGGALQEISDSFTKESNWLVTGCLHDDGTHVGSYHEPTYNDRIFTGLNTIGSPSVLTLRKESRLLFDTSLSWLLDVDLYKRLHDSFGSPTILNVPNVVIGIHKGQASNTMSDADKLLEHSYLHTKYAK